MKLESSSHQNNEVLKGLRIIVTRPQESAAALSEPLRALGAQPIEVPVIGFGYADNIEPLDLALDEIINGHYDWVIFTSVNGVKYSWERLVEKGYTENSPLPCKVAAIGPATAKSLEARGVGVDFVPEIYVAEEIARGLGDVSDLQILLPRADIARKALPNMLRDSGALVNEVVAYRTIKVDPESEGLDEAIELIESDSIDWVTFTSSSTALHFVELMRDAGVDDGLVGCLNVACIGPITEQTARDLNLNVQLVASQHDIPGLVQALVQAVESRG